MSRLAALRTPPAAWSLPGPHGPDEHSCDEQNPGEFGDADPGDADPGDADPGGAEPGGAEPGDADPDGAEPGHAGSNRRGRHHNDDRSGAKGEADVVSPTSLTWFQELPEWSATAHLPAAVQDPFDEWVDLPADERGSRARAPGSATAAATLSRHSPRHAGRSAAPTPGAADPLRDRSQVARSAFGDDDDDGDDAGAAGDHATVIGDETHSWVDNAHVTAEPSSLPSNPGRVVRAPRIARTWGRFAELWVPEPLRDARVDPGRRGAWILLLVAVLAAVVTAVGVWRDRPVPVPITTTSLAAMAGASPATGTGGTTSAEDGAPATGTSSSAAKRDASSKPGAEPALPPGSLPQGPILVSVTGLVGKPGVVTLPGGSRVADAIAAAGGADAAADVTGMNLAAKLADGDSIVVSDHPASGPATAGGTHATPAGGTAGVLTTPAAGLVDLNSADQAALDTLPGVGPVMAANILAWREANGRFSSVDQLQEISGIGPSRFAQISTLVTVS